MLVRARLHFRARAPQGIERVINYELPADDFQDYIHRIGRTGRAGASGVADSLFTDGM